MERIDFVTPARPWERAYDRGFIANPLIIGSPVLRWPWPVGRVPRLLQECANVRFRG